MKKALLLAASTLLTASSALAGVIYVPTGETVTDATQLKDGLYLIMATRHNHPKGEGLLVATGEDATDVNHSSAKFNDPNYKTIPSSAFVDQNPVWDLKVVEDGLFTLKSVAFNVYFSINGENNQKKRNIKSTNKETEIAKYSAVKVTSDLSKDPQASNIVIDENVTRFAINATNASCGTNAYWYGNKDTDTGTNLLQYWTEPQSGSVQVQFIPVKEEQTVDITVTFPKWNGVDVKETLSAYTNADAETFINDYIEQHGGMNGMTIKSADADNQDNFVVSADNTEFVVEGDWNYDFSPNQVYRVCVNPKHMEAALRYMLITGDLRTHADSEEKERTESLKRLVPERLWFFKPVEGKENIYTIHNLYAPELGIHFDNTKNDATATLTDNPTQFELINKKELNQFYLRVAGTETAFVGDFGGKGFFSINNQTVDLVNTFPDNGSVIQIYPLDNDDYATLGVDPDINYAYADNETFTGAISDWNAQNIAAAIRRIEFWGGESMIGNKPGQFNNEDDTFLKKLEYAKQLLADKVTDPEILKPAVDDISYDKLSKYTPVIPGCFYRLKNRKSGRYLSNLTGMTQDNQSYIDMVLPEDAIYSNTVWYYMKDGEDTMLVSFDSGCVLSTMDGTAGYRPVVSTDICTENKDKPNAYDRDAAAKGVEISLQKGAWHAIHLREYLKSNATQPTHRHLHGAYNYAAAGEHESLTSIIFTSSDYLWQVELVEELPVPIYNDEDTEAAWASIYSPVPLEIQNGEAVAYTGKFATDKVVKTEIGNIIPANTPVLLDYKKGAETPDRPADSFRNGVMYLKLKVLYDGAPSEAMLYDGEEETTPTPEVEGQDLNGGILAISKEDGTKYFSLHTTNTNNFREYEGIKLGPSTTAAYIPGFKAHLALTPEQADNLTSDENGTIIPIKAANDNTDGISEVTSESVKAVYDLQGRKLAAPAKGINIINGKKVLVK